MWIAIQTLPRWEFRLAARLGDMFTAEEVFLPVWSPPPPLPSSASEGPRRRRLVFTRYVFIRPKAVNREALERFRRLEGVERILSPVGAEASRIEDHEIEALRRLCASPRFPERRTRATGGDWVRVARGPFAGMIGVVARADERNTVLSFALPVFAGAYELTVPSELVEVTGSPTFALSRLPSDARHYSGRKSRHRAGKRARRERRSTD